MILVQGAHIARFESFDDKQNLQLHCIYFSSEGTLQVRTHESNQYPTTLHRWIDYRLHSKIGEAKYLCDFQAPVPQKEDTLHKVLSP